MENATQVATAYVTLQVDASKVNGQIEKAVRGASARTITPKLQMDASVVEAAVNTLRKGTGAVITFGRLARSLHAELRAIMIPVIGVGAGAFALFLKSGSVEAQMFERRIYSLRSAMARIGKGIVEHAYTAPKGTTTATKFLGIPGFKTGETHNLYDWADKIAKALSSLPFSQIDSMINKLVTGGKWLAIFWGTRMAARTVGEIGHLVTKGGQFISEGMKTASATYNWMRRGIATESATPVVSEANTAAKIQESAAIKESSAASELDVKAKLAETTATKASAEASLLNATAKKSEAVATRGAMFVPYKSGGSIGFGAIAESRGEGLATGATTAAMGASMLAREEEAAATTKSTSTLKQNVAERVKEHMAAEKGTQVLAKSGAATGSMAIGLGSLLSSFKTVGGGLLAFVGRLGTIGLTIVTVTELIKYGAIALGEALDALPGGKRTTSFGKTIDMSAMDRVRMPFGVYSEPAYTGFEGGPKYEGTFAERAARKRKEQEDAVARLALDAEKRVYEGRIDLEEEVEAHEVQLRKRHANPVLGPESDEELKKGFQEDNVLRGKASRNADAIQGEMDALLKNIMATTGVSRQNALRDPGYLGLKEGHNTAVESTIRLDEEQKNIVETLADRFRHLQDVTDELAHAKEEETDAEASKQREIRHINEPSLNDHFGKHAVGGLNDAITSSLNTKLNEEHRKQRELEHINEPDSPQNEHIKRAMAAVEKLTKKLEDVMTGSNKLDERAQYQQRVLTFLGTIATPAQ